MTPPSTDHPSIHPSFWKQKKQSSLRHPAFPFRSDPPRHQARAFFFGGLRTPPGLRTPGPVRVPEDLLPSFRRSYGDGSCRVRDIPTYSRNRCNGVRIFPSVVFILTRYIKHPGTESIHLPRKRKKQGSLRHTCFLQPFEPGSGLFTEFLRDARTHSRYDQ
jgi:hypothetical protein